MSKRIALLVGLALLLPGADWIACIILQHRMRAEYLGWATTITSQGWSVRSDTVAEGGFPFGATLLLNNFNLSGGHAMMPGGLDWHSDRIRLTLGLLNFWRLTVEPQGEQTVRAAGTKNIVFSADRLTASVPLGRGRADSLALEADGLTAGLLQSQQRQDVRIDHLALGLSAQRHDAARITAQMTIAATGIALPDNNRWPLGASVRMAQASVDIASPALSGVDAADQARAWRDWGGVLTVQSLRLGWGPLDLSAQAKLSLDDRLQPAGKGDAAVSGWAQSLDALSASGTISPGMAQTAKLVMGLMAVAPTNGAMTDSLFIPFTLKDTTLSVGKIPLIKLHDLKWSSV